MSSAVVDAPRTEAKADVSRGLVVAIALVVFAAHVPLLFAHFRGLWLKPHYQLFPIVIAGAFVLLWPTGSFSFAKAGVLKPAMTLLALGAAVFGAGMLIESGEYAALGSPPNWIAAGGILMFASLPLLIFLGTSAPYLADANPAKGRLLVMIDVVMMAVVVFFGSLPGSAFSILMLMAALAFTLGGSALFRRCLPALVLLLLVVGPPVGLDTLIVQKLQVLAASVSSKLLDVFNVFHLLSGVVISVGERKYEVEGACSGISSLLSTLACVLFYVLYFRLHWLRSILLIMSAVLWVMVNNVLRIIGITAAGTLWNIDLSRGIPHQIFGMFLFGLTLLFLWSTDRLLMFFGRSTDPQRRFEPSPVAPSESSISSAFSMSGAYYASAPLAAIFAVFGGLQVAELMLTKQAPYSGSALSKIYRQMTVDVLPERFGAWQRPEKITSASRSAGNPMGEFSEAWLYRVPSMQIPDPTKPAAKKDADDKGESQLPLLQISFDYPYPEFHDIRVCYRNSGWTDTKTERFSVKSNDGRPDLDCVRVKLVQPYEQYASLWFCQFDQDGVPMDPSEIFSVSVSDKFTNRIAWGVNRWQRIFQPGRDEKLASGFGSVLQVQMLTETKFELKDRELQMLEGFFNQAALLLRAKAVQLKDQAK